MIKKSRNNMKKMIHYICEIVHTNIEKLLRSNMEIVIMEDRT